MLIEGALIETLVSFSYDSTGATSEDVSRQELRAFSGIPDSLGDSRFRLEMRISASNNQRGEHGTSVFS